MTVNQETEVDWGRFNKIFSDGGDTNVSFGSKHWASVYLASTPQQAAQMGIEFPGVNEVADMILTLPSALFIVCCIIK